MHMLHLRRLETTSSSLPVPDARSALPNQHGNAHAAAGWHYCWARMLVAAAEEGAVTYRGEHAEGQQLGCTAASYIAVTILQWLGA